MHICFVPFIQVQTTAYAFDKFALIVELGSSLGLWLGLSAISFLDLVLIYFRNRLPSLGPFNKLQRCKGKCPNTSPNAEA